MARPAKYDKKFIKEVLKYAKTDGKTAATRRFNIGMSTLYKWMSGTSTTSTRPVRKTKRTTKTTLESRVRTLESIVTTLQEMLTNKTAS